MCAFAAIRLHVITFVTSARHVVKRLVRVAILLTGFFALFIGRVGATPGIPGTLDPFFATGSALGPGKLLQSITAGGDLVSALVLRPDGSSFWPVPAAGTIARCASIPMARWTRRLTRPDGGIASRARQQQLRYRNERCRAV